MLKKYGWLVLVCLLSSVLVMQPLRAATAPHQKVTQPDQVKDKVLKFGVGEKARVKLQLKTKTSLKGYIAETGADNFVVVVEKTNIATTVAYDEVAQIKGTNRSTGAKIAIGAGIGGAAFLVLAVVAAAVGAGAAALIH